MTRRDDPAGLNNRILIIDDNESIHADFRKVLCVPQDSRELDALEAELFGNDKPQPEGPQFEIDSALQGQEGLEMVRRAYHDGRPYAMAFVDMRMPPGWDGLQTIEQLWKVDPHLQVVICTAFSDYSWDQVVRRLGRSDSLLILKKPFDQAEVSQMAIALTQKWNLQRRASLKLEELDGLVQRRTAELHAQATHDALTGLPNRAVVGERLAEAMQRASRDGTHYAIMFLDFDRFKLVNDSFGHPVGDQLLVAIAERLTGLLRSACDKPPFVARIGGDEFVVLLADLPDTTRAAVIADALIDRLREPYDLHGREVFATASIGVTTSDMAYSSPTAVLCDADTAMYRAKYSGKDRVIAFDASMRQASISRLELESELRHALERGELELHYQAIVGLNEGQVVGFESLMRWRHPQRGWIPPIQFIPVAEEIGQILPIGRWALETAVAQLKQWQRLFPQRPPYIAVNVSKRQLDDPDFVTGVLNLLHEAQIDPGLLMLEVTESMIMNTAETVTPVLEQLRAAGVRLAMDDFGTGHSSLSCLHRFPINVLKIDRAFIANLQSNRAYSAVVQAIITLAANLNMTVTAEGIETIEQLAQMLALDCHCGQGWLFAKALPADAAERLLLEGLQTRLAA